MVHEGNNQTHDQVRGMQKGANFTIVCMVKFDV